MFARHPELVTSKVSIDAGLDNSTVRKLLSGENASPKIETAERIAKAVGYPLSSIIAIGTHPDAHAALDLVSQFESLPADDQAALLRFFDYLRSKSEPGEPEATDVAPLPFLEKTKNRGR